MAMLGATEGADAVTGELDASALAAAMLGEEERRHAEAAQADEVTELDNDELFGVGGDGLTLRQVIRIGGWATVGILLVLNIINEVDGLTLSVLAPNIQKSFHLSYVGITFISGLGAVAVFAGAMPLGLLADRKVRPLIVGISSVVWGFASLITGSVQAAWQFGAVRAVNGVGKGNVPVVQSLLSDQYPIEGRNRVFALYNVASTAGPVIGPILAASITTVAGGTNGWRWAFVILGLPAMVFGVLALFLRDPGRGTNEIKAITAERRAQTGAPGPGPAGSPGSGVAGPMSHIVGHPDFMVPGEDSPRHPSTRPGHPETTTPDEAGLFGSMADLPQPSLTFQAGSAVSMSAAFDRLKKIKTFMAIMSAIAALGLMFSGSPIVLSIYLRDHYHLSALGRGTVISLVSLGGIIGLTVGAPLADRLFRRDPAQVLRLVGIMLGIFPVLYVSSLYMPKVWELVLVQMPAAVCLFAPALCGAMLASVVPYRIRGFSFAMLGLYLVVVGGLLGGVLTGILADSVGPRTSLSIIIPLGCVFAAGYMLRAAGSVRHDMSLVVEEMREELEEAARQAAGGSDDHFVQVRNLDFSYGPVQVLFDVNFEVARGETLALLGTNGAGKSTLLRAISGLALPDRGVIRLDGASITYLSPRERVRKGVIQVAGGRAVFPTMTVEENLLVGAATFIWEHERIVTKTEEVLTLFPDLRALLQQPAGTLSGGEQQMLALAKALLLDPEILLIDELSLGLAPIVVQEIVKVVERLKAAGTTMIIVEQSINVALTVADRAIFMEKGRIRYDGPTATLLESGDLARAVFLGEDFGG
jgi:ABC-type branched-subunit amino acid transport system ATPase component/sugar phosphate permease